MEKKFRGVRRRKWGKWVSEIRVPGTQERLWLGSYSMPEAAAVAHDVAYYCLHRPITLQTLNFPLTLPAGVSSDMSPRSIQKAASDAGMAADAQFISGKTTRESFMKEEEEKDLYRRLSLWKVLERVLQRGQMEKVSAFPTISEHNAIS